MIHSQRPGELNILLVEDNADDVELTRVAFEQNRITNPLHVVRDGQEALDYLFGCGAYEGTNEPPEPWLVLLDLKLPKVDGLEVLRRLKSDPNRRRIPVVVMTSSQEETDLVRSYDLGANSYIVKPVDFEQFYQTVRSLGYYWLVVNQPPPPSSSRLGPLR